MGDGIMAEQRQQQPQQQPQMLPTMPTPQQAGNVLFLPSQPGVRRDGTFTDSDFYSDAQWCRFIRNRPRKMGGYREIVPFFSGPVRGAFLWSHQFSNIYCTFSKYGIEYTYVDQNGVGGYVTSITPSGYTYNENTIWAYDYLFDAASGANATLLIASPMLTLQNMDDPTLSDVYVTPLNNPAQMTKVADAAAKCSGGIFCTHPYTVLLGNDGNITWSDANAPQTYSSGDAGSARVTGTKLVKGLPMRTGISSGGLLWSLDSVIRMDYIGGSAIFKFSHISTKSSVLSQSSIIEYDGKWYWIGIDRFMVSNGVQVEELANDMNLQWFLDTLNFSQRQKVYAMKMPRFGEIWWCFPSGESEECDQAVIFNTRTKIWYDTRISRSHGIAPATYRYPIMAASEPNNKLSLTISMTVGTTFAAGDYLQGKATGAGVYVNLVTGSGPYTLLVTRTNTDTFMASETLVRISERYDNNGNVIAGAKEEGQLSAQKSLYTVYSHECGWDAIEDQGTTAIPSHFTTCEFGAPTGGAQPNVLSGHDRYTRITRVEPDFKMQGEMTCQVLSSTFAQTEQKEGNLYTFMPNTGKIDMRDQAREFRLRFSSNELGGYYEGGKTLVHIEPGDVRP